MPDAPKPVQLMPQMSVGHAHCCQRCHAGPPGLLSVNSTTDSIEPGGLLITVELTAPKDDGGAGGEQRCTQHTASCAATCAALLVLLAYVTDACLRGGLPSCLQWWASTKCGPQTKKAKRLVRCLVAR